jgi:DNA-directed RNA polymerase specialized sigma24 family protein
MQPKTYDSYEGINWEAVYERLHMVALHCTDLMPDIFDGVSAEDVVTQVLCTFFESPNGLGWDPLKGPLDRFLLGILKHKTVDHIRRDRQVAGSFDDPGFTTKIPFVDPTALGSEVLNVLSEQVHQAANGDSELEELVTATNELDGSHNINQQLAKELKTTPTDIVNRKRRLIRKFQRRQ